jgi:hypothetical protein
MRVNKIVDGGVFDKEDDEKDLQDTVNNAIKQIDDMHYETDLIDAGVKPESIYKYGMAFLGKK